jgi:hypothetical protein
MTLDDEMRAVILAMRMLGGGKTQSFDSSGGKAENPDPRPSGEPSPMADHWVRAWRERPTEDTLEAARAELRAWKVRQAPAEGDGTSEDDWIIRDGEGFSADQVARKFNRTPSMVRRLRLKNGRESEFGLPTDGSKAVDNSRDRVLNLASQGCTLRQIEFQTGVSKSKVQRWLKDAA